ncbi:uncharacterized protein C1orf21 homolog isoform X2 [Heterocephalus glaber]|uniref:Uncharacterized protein C1orf21 homolog isoform X2 n=1 Tax=Heterocephalus glaber TaxID=10181 RepID=A0AAX6RL92_HETGA|nr:uncharacterized protein C1orf21 homolog isoform X2 [Heterocephalus glaber]
MGCASAKHVATVQNEEEAQKGKNYQNGDVFGDEYRIKPVEEVKYMKNGAEEEQKIAARNQENLFVECLLYRNHHQVPFPPIWEAKSMSVRGDLFCPLPSLSGISCELPAGIIEFQTI